MTKVNRLKLELMRDLLKTGDVCGAVDRFFESHILIVGQSVSHSLPDITRMTKKDFDQYNNAYIRKVFFNCVDLIIKEGCLDTEPGSENDWVRVTNYTMLVLK